MIPSVHIFVNGILNWPGDSENWTRRAVTWTHIHTDGAAESLEYLCGPLTRALHNASRADKLARKVRFYNRAGLRPNVVGHSNGCDVICDALKLAPDLAVDRVTLISAACAANFWANGLNAALGRQRVASVSVWTDTEDRALWWASTWLGQWLGYGALGRTGAEQIATGIAAHVTRHDSNQGHSDWFNRDYFDATMRRIHDQD